MTVLTFPSVCGKSDKALLIGDEEVHRPGQTQPPPPPPPPPPYHPSSLENGNGGLACGKRPKICIHGRIYQIQLLRNIVQIAVGILVFLLFFYFAIIMLCRVYKCDSYHPTHRMNTQDNDVAAEDTVPCKSYTSYAAAENDMLSMPPSSPPPSNSNNRVITMVVYPVEGSTEQKLPHMIINKSARFVHDFSVNITGIIDMENQRCYVMPLIRSYVDPPESLYDMLIKMVSGYYSSDINRMLKNFRMVKPALDDLSDYGMYISKDCADYPTFKLEKNTMTDSP